MFSNFGNINDMTKSQFQKASEYYENRVKMMTEDKSISDDARNWFLSQYNERIKSLKQNLEELELAINRLKNSGAIIDDSHATLSSTGSYASSYANFDSLSQNEHRYRVSQGWKIAGAILLPLVGTIPFLRSWNAARKRRNAIEAKINSENVELGNFVSKEKRPYEATLLTSTKFTEEEMANLLEDTAELNRIANLVTATPSPITPIQRKNLISKLVDVREFGQKNDYDVSAILTDPVFETSIDKTKSKIATHQTTFSSISSSATTLKQAYDAIKQLEELRTKVQELYNSSKDKSLETLLNNIDSKIATLKATAKTKINDGANDIVTNINNETGRPTDDGDPTEESLTNAINAVNGFVDNANLTYFGAGVNAEQARRMAEELGFTSETDEYKKFDEIQSARTSKLEKLNTELAKVESESEIKNQLTTFNSYFEESHDFMDTANASNISNLKRLLAQVEANYNYLKQNLSSLSDDDRKSFFENEEKFRKRKDAINKASFTYAPTPSDYATYKSWINAVINTTADKDTLENQLDKLEKAKFNLESDSFKTMMTEIDPRFGPEIERLITTATNKIEQIEKLIEKIDKGAEVQINIDTYNSIIDELNLDDVNKFTYIEDKTTTSRAIDQLNNILKKINDIDTSSIDSTTNTNLRALRTRITKGLDFLSKTQSEPTTADIIKNVKSILNKTTPDQISDLIRYITLLENRKTSLPSDIQAQVNYIISQAEPKLPK